MAGSNGIIIALVCGGPVSTPALLANPLAVLAALREAVVSQTLASSARKGAKAQSIGAPFCHPLEIGFFQMGTKRLSSSMSRWQAAKASARWGAITSTHSAASPTFTAPSR